HDQKKGFNMLEPDRFYDALQAYGLPTSIIDLDCSSQHEVLYCVKTAYGFTDPFMVSGVMKQGGSLSSLKCTLTTSLGSHWVADLIHQQHHSLIVSTSQACQNDPHSTADSVTIQPTSVKAMDDSLLFATLLPSLHLAVQPAKQFQATYSWETEWRKSALYTYQPDDPTLIGPTVDIPSVNYANPLAPTMTWNLVPLVTSHTTFLKVLVDCLALHFNHIWDIILQFNLPSLSTPLPFTVIHKIICQQLISKI
ncbi:hypothetical protein DXG03_000910, partial [Asterophora parasitica]